MAFKGLNSFTHTKFSAWRLMAMLNSNYNPQRIFIGFQYYKQQLLQKFITFTYLKRWYLLISKIFSMQSGT